MRAIAVLSRLALVSALAASPVLAQQRPVQPPRPTPQQPVQPQPAEPEPPTPYEPQLLRLAEIMGALTHLRDLCGANDGEAWRTRMANLVAVEGVTQARKERLAGAFNRGFRGYEQTHRTCTPGATLTMERFIEEGAKLSREIASRFSG